MKQSLQQSLQLRLGQRLAMTPQLRQAIRLLQLSTTELHAEVREALDSNLMLELDDDDPSDPGPEAAGVFEVAPADIPGELPVDAAWEDVHDAVAVHHDPARAEPGGTDLVALRARTESLRDSLSWQAALMRLDDAERAIAAAIIDAVDDDGYLTLPLEDLRHGLDLPDRDVTPEAVEAVLRQVQSLDPPGVAARSLGECLAIQLRELPPDTAWRDAALALVAGHLPLLASKDHAALMHALGLGRHELQCVVDLVRSLSPRPGAAVGSSPPEYVVPDVFVRRARGEWKVELNPDASPRLRVNARYADLIRPADDGADNLTLKSHLREAHWFIRGLLSRNETLLKTATCIVGRQRGFLEHGEEAMKPMVLADVAHAIGMHPSTVARASTRKYMHTPRGLFELKYFFSGHVPVDGGPDASSTAVRAVLGRLIADEDPARPLSDQKLKELLSRKGVRIARRTVTKYREAMAIPSSTGRRVR